MFHCAIGNHFTKPGDKAFPVVTEWREKIYPRREEAQRYRKEGKRGLKADPGGQGHEIAKEVLSCRECYQQVLADQATQQQESGSW